MNKVFCTSVPIELVRLTMGVVGVFEDRLLARNDKIVDCADMRAELDRAKATGMRYDWYIEDGGHQHDAQNLVEAGKSHSIQLNGF